MVREDSGSNQPASRGRHRTLSLRARRRFRPDNLVTDGQELARLAHWFIEREQQPHLVVDEASRVLLMNTAAEQLLETTSIMTVTAGRLAFDKPRPRLELRRMLAGQRDSSSFLVRAAGVPMSVSIRRCCTSSGGTLLVIATSPVRLGDCEHLRAELGLSCAEAEIALEIFKGSSLVAVARGRGASINTVKTQVRNLFHKCKVHSQVTLARRIGEVLWK